MNTVVIGDASVAYDVKNEPDAKDGRFDINHIKIYILILSYSFSFREK